MKAFVVEDGIAVPFDQADVDTDQILPARFLRRPRQGGYGQFLFRDVRFHEDDTERPEFILNQAPYRQATIMVADRNFGCGSSREQAPWGLVDHGIRCVIAADFGDIFYLNSLKTGLLPVQLDIAVCVRLREQLHAQPGARVRVDLPAQTVTAPDGQVYAFHMDAFRKKCLVEGLDEIGVTLQNDAGLKAFEVQYRQAHPWLFNL